MKKPSFTIGLSCLLAPLLFAASLSADTKPNTWVQPFNGKSLEGWNAKPGEFANHWKAEGGMIVGENSDKKGSTLWTDREYRDFELRLEYMTPSKDYDSGVFARATSHQVQIGVSRSLKKDLTGCIYAPKDKKGKYPAVSDKVAEVHKLGEWNKLHIIVEGNRIRTRLNGKGFVDYLAVTIPEKGPIGLQLHGGVHMKMLFRNIGLKELVEPKVVDPKYEGTPVPAPEGAVVLFDGKDASQWKQFPRKKDKDQSDTFRWKIENGYAEVVPGTGYVGTREKPITSGHLHIEWATPAEVKGNSQGRGNSGVFIEGFPEVQVLDSYNNKTYYDGQAAALYKASVPLVNASRGPGLWQSYDIHVTRAVLEEGKRPAPATITVYHNNVLVQDKVEFMNKTKAGSLRLQDHSNPVRYRNIWFKPAAE